MLKLKAVLATLAGSTFVVMRRRVSVSRRLLGETSYVACARPQCQDSSRRRAILGENEAVGEGNLAIQHPVGPSTKPGFGILHQLYVFSRSLRIKLLRIFWYEPIFKSQCRVVGPGFAMGRLVFLQGVGSIDLGANFTLSVKSNIEFCNQVLDRPTLRIGDTTCVGHNSSICVAHAVKIGDHRLVGGDVIIRDYDGHPADALARRMHPPVPTEFG